jgi:hypothetical protein
MKALAGSVLFSMVAAGAPSFLPADEPQSERIVPNLRMESSTVDPQTAPKVLERRFGRDTLLYSQRTAWETRSPYSSPDSY